MMKNAVLYLRIFLSNSVIVLVLSVVSTEINRRITFGATYIYAVQDNFYSLNAAQAS